MDDTKYFKTTTPQFMALGRNQTFKNFNFTNILKHLMKAAGVIMHHQQLSLLPSNQGLMSVNVNSYLLSIMFGYNPV